LEFCW